MSWINLLKQEFIFLTQLLLKIPVFELNIPFVFHRTWAIDIQSILEFLQLIYDFLASNNTVIPFVYVFPIVQVLSVKWWSNGYSTVPQALCCGWKRGFDSRVVVLAIVGLNVKLKSPVVSSINSSRNFAYHSSCSFDIILWDLSLFK